MFHQLVPGTSRNWIPQTFRGRIRLEIRNTCSSCKKRNRYVIEGLLLQKKFLNLNFFIKSLIFVLSSESPLKAPCRFRALEPLGDLQRTSLGRRELAG